MPIKKEPSLQLMRHLLASIDLSDIEEESMTESERKAYSATIFSVYPIIEKDIKKMLYEELLFINNEAADWQQVLFGRGTTNGMFLLLEKWKAISAEYKAPNDEEPTNVNSPIGEI